MDARTRDAADRERRDAPAKPASTARHYPDGGRPRRRSARSRQRAILRLGAEEPRGADANAGADRREEPYRRRRASATEGYSRHRLCRAGLLRAAAKEMHGRLGTAILQHFAGRQDLAVPRGRKHYG